MNPRRRDIPRRHGIATIAVLLFLSLAVASPATATTAATGDATGVATGEPAASTPLGGHDTQPAIGARGKPVLTVDGRTFKDLDASGTLDRYEDWRRPAAERAADLVARMSLQERAGLMLIDTLNADCRGALPDLAQDYLGDQQMRRFIFRNAVSDRPECAGETAEVTPTQAATFTNAVQQAAEASRLGIPVLFKSNARNHLDPDPRPGINVAADAMTAFPKEAGIAAAALGEQARRTGKATDGDMQPVRAFADVMGKEWAAIGLRGMYGYMADLSTEPRWYRVHETFTENAELDANIVTTLVGTLQGEVDETGSSLSPESDVALTMKHFPGGGPQELGLDPHYSFGKTQVYPGGRFADHLVPFEAAIKAGVSSVMPYYGVPMNVTHDGVRFQQTGMAFSDQIVNGLLRDTLGFKGYVNSDTGIINDRAWGLEDKTVPQRVAAAVNGGSDTLSGFHDVTTITDLVRDGLVDEARVELAATRLLTPMFELGLFEDPYVDAAAADGIVGSKAGRATALEIQRRSVVLLKNDLLENDKAGTAKPRPANALPLAKGETLYMLGRFDKATVESYGYTVIDGNATPRPSAAGADRVIVSMSGRNVNQSAYRSNSPETGLNPDHINPIRFPGVAGLDGKSPYGAADACVTQQAPTCTDDGLEFGGSFPWESSVLDFTGMSKADSWEVTPALSTIRQAMREVKDPDKVVLNVYFRQPYVLDEASGLLGAGAVLANFGTSDAALMDVLTGAVAPQGKLPFALPKTRRAVEQQHSDAPGYAETADGARYDYGFGLTYGRDHGRHEGK